MGVEDWPIALGKIQDIALAEMLSGDDVLLLPVLGVRGGGTPDQHKENCLLGL